MQNLFSDGDYDIYKLTTHEDFLQWNDFLLKSQQAHPFSSIEYLKIMCELFNLQFDILISCKKNNWLVGAPIIYRRLFNKNICCIPPLTVYNSFVYAPSKSTYHSKNTSEHIAVSKNFVLFIKQHYYKMIYLLNSCITDIRPWLWNGRCMVKPQYTYHIDLQEELQLSHSVRKHVRKCDENNYTVLWDWQMEHFWQMFEHTVDRKNLSASINKQQFFSLANQLYAAGLAWMGTAYEPGGSPVSSRIQMALPGSDKLFDWVAGAHSDFLSTGATPWLMVNFIQEARRRNYAVWDLCGANIESVARFKSELGGRLVNYFQVQSIDSLLEYSLYGFSQACYMARKIKENIHKMTLFAPPPREKTLNCNLSRRKYHELCAIEPDIPIFSKDWWLDAVCGEDNWDVVLLEQGGQIIASWPYYLRRKYVFNIIAMPKLTQTMGIWLKYPPQQKYATKLSFEKDVYNEMIDKLPKTDLFRQNFHYSITNWLPFYWREFAQTTRYTYVIELRDVYKIFNNFQSNIRREIRKAQSKVEVVVLDDIDLLYDIDKMTFDRQNISMSISRAFLRELDEACFLHKCRRIFFARDEEQRIHAAIYIVWDGQSAYYLMGGVHPKLRTSGATILLMWEAIKFASTVTKKFDFEGSMIEPVEHFFRAFGAVQKPYFAISRANRKVRICQAARDLGRAVFTV